MRHIRSTHVGFCRYPNAANSGTCKGAWSRGCPPRTPPFAFCPTFRIPLSPPSVVYACGNGEERDVEDNCTARNSAGSGTHDAGVPLRTTSRVDFLVTAEVGPLTFG